MFSPAPTQLPSIDQHHTYPRIHFTYLTLLHVFLQGPCTLIDISLKVPVLASRLIFSCTHTQTHKHTQALTYSTSGHEDTPLFIKHYFTQLTKYKILKSPFRTNLQVVHIIFISFHKTITPHTDEESYQSKSI